MRSAAAAAEIVLSTFFMDAPFKVSGIDAISEELDFTTGMRGKSNSIENFLQASCVGEFEVFDCFSPTTFLAVRSPDFAKNSTTLHPTRPNAIR